MRPVIVLALSVLSAAHALAADFPVLRGGYTPAPTARASDDQTQWDGFYAGGFGGYGAGKFNDFRTSSPNSLMANFYNGGTVPGAYQQTRSFTLPFGSARSTVFGGFAGYNMAFGDAVVGLEVDVTKLAMKYTSTQSYLVQNINGAGIGYSQLTGSSTSKLDAYATFRARAGWAYGAFMPFITGGLAVGKGSYNSTLSTIYSATAAAPPTADGSLTQTTGRNNVFVVGGTVGAGVDMLLASNILLRAEYQYVHFAGRSIPLEINAVRIGAGVKF